MHEALMGRFFDMTLALFGTARREGNTFENMNPAWERTLGWTREELCSRSFISFVHPDDVQPTLDMISEMDDGAPAVHFENRYQHKDGSWVWLSWVTVLEDGVYYAAAIDVTPYKVSEAMVSAANAELKQFAYGASHDLREPLRGISGHLALVDGTGLDAQSLESLQYAKAGAQQMQRLLDGLLSYTRVAAAVSQPAIVSMAKVFQDSLMQLDAAIRESNASIHSDGVMPSLYVDATQMTQVFQNVLANAIKYRKPGQPPSITVNSRPQSGGWLFEVVDDGVGLEPKDTERAFVIFQRLHRRSEYEGAGIGLALVKRIVHQHRGRSGIRSEPGNGTTMWFWLPERRGKA